MWQHLVIGVLVAAALWFLVRHLRRATVGGCTCTQGLCENCAEAADCAEKPAPADTTPGASGPG